MAFDEQQRSVARAIQGTAHNEAPVTHESSPVTRENAAHESAPSDSWQRFNQTRGNNDVRGNNVVRLTLLRQ